MSRRYETEPPGRSRGYSDGPYYDDDQFQLKEQLVDALATVERRRQRLECAADDLREMLENTYLKQVYDKFLQSGGITTDELRRFVNGKKPRIRLTRRKRHMRLVSTTDRPIFTSSNKRQGGNDAS
jgi:hypothetical protein